MFEKILKISVFSYLVDKRYWFFSNFSVSSKKRLKYACNALFFSLFCCWFFFLLCMFLFCLKQVFYQTLRMIVTKVKLPAALRGSPTVTAYSLPIIILKSLKKIFVDEMKSRLF